MICEVRKNFCQKKCVNEKRKQHPNDFEGRNVWNLLHCYSVLNNTICMCTYACVHRRWIFAYVLAGKVLLRLCVLNNSVVRVYNLYFRLSFHPCSLHSISWGFNECKNRKTAELPGALIMSVFISKVRLGLFGAGWKNFKEKKGQ